MKHLKKFNEISTGLSRNAYNAGSDKLPDDTDPIRRYKILKQNTKFQTYINPSLKEYLLRQGALDAKGYDEGISIRIPSKHENENSVWIKITKDSYSLMGDANSIADNMINKLPNLIKRVQADIKGENSIFNQKFEEYEFDDFEGDMDPDEESELQELYDQGADALTRAANLLGVDDNLDIKDAIQQLREFDTVEAIELIEEIEYIDTEINNLTQNFTDSFEDEEEELIEKKKWIGDALRRPGALRKKLGKKKGEKITLAEIGAQLAKLNRKDKDPKKKGVQLGKKDSRTKKQLNLAKTLKSFKKESLDIITYSEYLIEEAKGCGCTCLKPKNNGADICNICKKQIPGKILPKKPVDKKVDKKPQQKKK